MKTELRSNQILLIPEDILEEEYLKNFIFSVTYGHFIHQPNEKNVNKLTEFIIPYTSRVEI